MSTKLKANEKVNYVASTTFTIDRKYSDLKAIGKGSYGVVCSALDSTLGKKIAIKKITPMARHREDAIHVLREIKLMRHMGKHENIVTLVDIIVREARDELYIVMELLDSDLHRVIQSKQQLTDSHFQYFFFQLLCGVKYLHDNDIIHRDLKPGNLLVSRDCKLRITDFGLARERATVANEEGIEVDEPMTEHVVTRWYRPPELMLCPDGLYNFGVDMWSCGCILAEMLGRQPLFPGKNFVHQLTLIFDVIGTPQKRSVSHIKNAQALKFLDSQVGKARRPLNSVFASATAASLAAVDELLVFDPQQRSSVDEALSSDYLRGFGVGTDSLVFPRVSDNFEFEFEHSNATKPQLKQWIADEAASFNNETYGTNMNAILRPGKISRESSQQRDQASAGSATGSVGANATNATNTSRRPSSTHDSSNHSSSSNNMNRPVAKAALFGGRVSDASSQPVLGHGQVAQSGNALASKITAHINHALRDDKEKDFVNSELANNNNDGGRQKSIRPISAGVAKSTGIPRDVPGDMQRRYSGSGVNNNINNITNNTKHRSDAKEECDLVDDLVLNRHDAQAAARDFSNISAAKSWLFGNTTTESKAQATTLPKDQHEHYQQLSQRAWQASDVTDMHQTGHNAGNVPPPPVQAIDHAHYRNVATGNKSFHINAAEAEAEYDFTLANSKSPKVGSVKKSMIAAKNTPPPSPYRTASTAVSRAGSLNDRQLGQFPDVTADADVRGVISASAKTTSMPITAQQEDKEFIRGISSSVMSMSHRGHDNNEAKTVVLQAQQVLHHHHHPPLQHSSLPQQQHEDNTCDDDDDTSSSASQNQNANEIRAQYARAAELERLAQQRLHQSRSTSNVNAHLAVAADQARQAAGRKIEAAAAAPPPPPPPPVNNDIIHGLVPSRKKSVTVAKSPKFSKMSWERKTDRPAVPAGATVAGARAQTAVRQNTTAEFLQNGEYIACDKTSDNNRRASAVDASQLQQQGKAGGRQAAAGAPARAASAPRPAHGNGRDRDKDLESDAVLQETKHLRERREYRR